MNADQIEAIYNDEEPDVARGLLLPEAELGNPIAQFYVGQLCAEESPRNDEVAVGWFRKSAVAGYPVGIHYLASHMYFGFGTPQDIEGALKLFREAALLGLDASQWKLGQHLLSQPGHRDETLEWLRLAAAQGHGAARALLDGDFGDL